MQTETWYILDDGSAVHPREVAAGKDGKLRHKDGRAVAYRPDGATPRSRSVDLDSERAKAVPKPKAAIPSAVPAVAPATAKDIQPEDPKRGYATRETKAR